jgi:chaperonin GroES
MSFKPIGKRVLVEPMTPEEKTKGGIFLPDNAKEQGNQGIVRAVGTGNDDVKPGDHVVVERNYNTLMNVGGKLCWLLNQQDIVAVIETQKEWPPPAIRK